MNENPETVDKFLAAVIGIIYQGDETLTQPTPHDIFLQNLFNGTEEDLNINEYFKNIDFNYKYVFRGSLTTPPFTEGLLWTVIP